MTRRKIQFWAGSCLVALAAIVAVGYPFFGNPLPRDEEMIRYLAENRAQLEKLVGSFRASTNDTGAVWENTKVAQVLLEAAGIKWISPTGTSLWVSNPYSQDASSRMRALIGEGGDKYFVMQRQYGALKLTPGDQRYGPRLVLHRWRLATIWKDLYYIPQIPKISNGILIEPVNAQGKEGLSTTRVSQSLNEFPNEWKRGECLIRPIDPLWHIRLCWGA